MLLGTFESQITKTPLLTLDNVAEQAQTASAMLARIRGDLYNPSMVKQPPVFSGAKVAELCGIDKPAFHRRLARKDLPEGRAINAARREFTLIEARQWVAAHSVGHVRVPGEKAVTIAVGLFKGGVGKTTTAMSLGQGLSLKFGYKVLLVDLDPQGSLSSLCGFQPDADISEDQTAYALFEGSQQSLRYAVTPTYWDGIDCVPASPSLFAAEFHLPARQSKSRGDGFRFWEVLDRGLEELRPEYDVIIIDTPPALSYVTLNAFLAADGLILPIPPKGLDFASAAQFWTLFSDIAGELSSQSLAPKTYRFINVLLSMVDLTDPVAPTVTKWIGATYRDKVLPVEIPKTNVANVAGVQFGTVYDVSRYAGKVATYARARTAYDRVVDLVEKQIRACWLSANS